MPRPIPKWLHEPDGDSRVHQLLLGGVQQKFAAMYQNHGELYRWLHLLVFLLVGWLVLVVLWVYLYCLAVQTTQIKSKETVHGKVWHHTDQHYRDIIPQAEYAHKPFRWDPARPEGLLAISEPKLPKSRVLQVLVEAKYPTEYEEFEWFGVRWVVWGSNWIASPAESALQGIWNRWHPGWSIGLIFQLGVALIWSHWVHLLDWFGDEGVRIPIGFYHEKAEIERSR